MVCDDDENRNEMGRSAQQVEDKRGNQTAMMKDIKEKEWQTLASILNKWSMALYLISNLIAFLGFWAKVKDQI